MNKKFNFYNELKKHQLSKKEFHYHLNKFLSLKDSTSKQKLVNHFLPMALKLCTKLQKNHPSIDLFDLFNQAFLIIHETIDYYDPNKGISLSTYIYNNLKWNLKNYIASIYQPVQYPKSIKKKLKKQGVPFHAISLTEIEEMKQKPIKNTQLAKLLSQLYINHTETNNGEEEE